MHFFYVSRTGNFIHQPLMYDINIARFLILWRAPGTVATTGTRGCQVVQVTVPATLTAHNSSLH